MKWLATLIVIVAAYMVINSALWWWAWQGKDPTAEIERRRRWREATKRKTSDGNSEPRATDV